MSMEELVADVAKQLDRRSFLGKAGAAVVGGLMALMGLPQTASAIIRYKCCNLCKGASTSCSNCACTWCWSCQWSDGYWYRCCECHSNTSYCGGDCDNVTCSWSTRIGTMRTSLPVQ